jgi:pyridoxamine 5'-phosphate oxidase
MSSLLYRSAPEFDQPLAVLKHCHGKILKQLETLSKLGPHLATHGADEQARQAADAIARYFTQAAPLHHEDEEINLMPMLAQTATGADAHQLAALIPSILAEHQKMAVLWNKLEPQLAAISAGQSHLLDAADVQEFASLYGQHLLAEESYIAPMAQRLFSAAQMQELSVAMQARRGIHQQ